MKLYKGLPWMKYRSPNNTILLGRGVMQLDMNWKNLIQFFKVYSIKKLEKILKALGKKYMWLGSTPPLL